ncbi:MAG TPA: glutaminyl-peptide cyclotransferase [Steroidobacteraceae bacterium]|jgi:DNA-binding beta-propeller fold protein YncE
MERTITHSFDTARWRLTLITGLAALAMASTAAAQESTPSDGNLLTLQLEAKIPLGSVRGRIDHMAIDLARRRLFVAELGNGSVGVVDLNERKVVRRLTGFREPQGIGYVTSSDTVYIASGGDGIVSAFAGADLTAVGRISLGDDADNVRVDQNANRIIVGYGSGALAVLDPATRTKIAHIALKAHPESLQLDRPKGRIFANVPNAHEIAVVDLAAGKQVASWKLPSPGANFPMAIDESAGTVIVVLRNPARLVVLKADDGGTIAQMETCNDSDDVFVDRARKRIYVSCGEGAVDVIATSESKYRRIGRLQTVSGARTSLFVPELDRLFVAARAGAEPAAIWALRPTP